MNRKTITAAILAAAMLTVMTGCGGQDSTGTVSTAAPSESSTPAEPVEQSGTEPAEQPAEDSADSPAPTETEAPANSSITFDYVLNGTTLAVGEEAAPMLEKLGEADSVFEAPSCAFTGVSYFYTYGGVQVVTYPDEHDQSLNRLYEVDLNDNTAATNEGVRVGDTYDDVIAKYGTPDQETPAYAMYAAEGKAVRFFFDGETVKQIVYTIVLN